MMLAAMHGDCMRLQKKNYGAVQGFSVRALGVASFREN
jgi:hypothetical protein